MLLKRWLVGDPLKTAQAEHERLSKRLALAIFSSNSISSVAYATEEILLVLILAGTAALAWSIPVSLAIVHFGHRLDHFVLAKSFLNIRKAAEPTCGFALQSWRDGLALIAAAALMIDYVLTVAVSVAAGVAAITSAIPSLFPHRTALGVLSIVFILVVNLRGARESGKVLRHPHLHVHRSIGLLMVGRGAVSTPLRHVDSAPTSDRGRRNEP